MDNGQWQWQWVDLARARVSDVVIWMKIDELHSATWTYILMLVRDNGNGLI